MMPHPAELFWTLLFMLSWVVVLHRGYPGGLPWALLAGAALGMLLLTRQITAVIVGVPFLTITALGHLRHHRPGSLLLHSGLLVAGVGAAVFFLLGYQDAVTGDPLRDPRLLYWPFDRVGFGPDVGRRYNVARPIQTPEGIGAAWSYDPDLPPNDHTPARGLFNVERNWRSLEHHLFGWPFLFTLSFGWLAFLLKRPNRYDLALLGTFAAALVAYVTYWASGIMYGPRYFYGAMPALLLLTARGMGHLADWLGDRTEPTAGRRATAVMVALLVGGSLLFSFPSYYESYQDYNFIDGEPLTQVQQQIDGKALVFVDDEGGWWQYGRFFSVNSPWLDTQLVVVRDLGRGENGRLRRYFPGYPVYYWRDGQLTPTLPRAPL